MSFLEALKDPNGVLNNDHNFLRYWSVWKENESSYTFLPLAEILRSHDFIAEAREICEKGLSHHPESTLGLLVLARIYKDLGDAAKAKDIVKELLSLIPTNRDVLNLASALRVKAAPKPAPPPPAATTNNNAPAESKSQLAEASPWETVTMAEVYANQGDVEKGIHICENLLAQNPKNTRARQLLEQLQTRLSGVTHA